jgi:hypothetical protein
MTLEDLDAELARLPATPKTDEDLDARAALMKRRIELDQAQRATAEAASRPKPKGNLAIFVPAAVGTSTYYSDRGRVAHARVAECGRFVLDLYPVEFRSLLMGRDGLHWHNSNPDAVRALGQP